MNISYALLLAVAVVTTAPAVTITQTNTLETAEVLAAVTSGTYAGVYYGDYEYIFEQFDPGLGVLKEVRFSSSISHTSSATNNNSNPAEWTFITTSYGIDYTANNISLFGNGTGGGNGVNTYNEFFSVTDSAEISDQTFNPAYYSEFTGTGTMTFRIERFSNQTPGYTAEIFGDFIGFTVQRDAGAYVSVTYDYTPFAESVELWINGRDVSFVSTSNEVYEIQSCTNLSTGIWTSCTNLAATGDSTLIKLNSSEPTLFLRGYRLE